MRTFFFSARQETCATECRWWICPQRYLAALRKIDSLRKIEIFDEAPSGFSRIPETSPKNGDLIILYAKNLDDLEAMLRARELFDGLKKILVVAEQTPGDDKRYHLLEPRYITQSWRNIDELEAVIRKMSGSVH